MINLTKFTERIVTLSTAHIPQHTANALGSHLGAYDAAELRGEIHYTPWGDYGWLIWADSESCEEPMRSHPELQALMTMCTDHHVQWLRLDCDAPPHPDLPTFEWEPA